MRLDTRWVFRLFLLGLFIASIIVLVIIYYLPNEELITRQLLFGLTFQIWGILVTILIVQKMLGIRDTQRWTAINKYVFNFLYLNIWVVIGKMFDIYKVKINVKQSETIEKFGVEYFNPEHTKEWKQKAMHELQEVVKAGSEAIKKNMQSWQPSTHKAFSETLKEFKNEINELLESFPHQIPPEFLSEIVDVRERARGLSNQSLTASSIDIMKEHGIDYEEINTGIIEIESVHVHDLFSKLLKLLSDLEKKVEPEYR